MAPLANCASHALRLRLAGTCVVPFLEFDLVTFAQGVAIPQFPHVHENVIAAMVWSNEAETFVMAPGSHDTCLLASSATAATRVISTARGATMTAGATSSARIRALVLGSAAAIAAATFAGFSTIFLGLRQRIVTRGTTAGNAACHGITSYIFVSEICIFGIGVAYIFVSEIRSLFLK
eukprot:GEMP01079474.1.p1 GENE.GEMP01079474.1~~GEMP01079474.1.p1  ORF type:complete len:178 (-),score=35.76 GEMP01079474.1:141-674(-)